MKFLILFAIFALDYCSCKEIFIDPETGHEVWRMTNFSEPDYTLYYDFPTVSPNGKYIMYRSNRVPFIYLAKTDGSFLRPVGSWNFWVSQRDTDFSANNLIGWWSHDSRFYYAYKKLWAIDIDCFISGQSLDTCVSQISQEHQTDFYYPMLSPDGRTLFGVGYRQDSSIGGILKLINIDGTNYREFFPPCWYDNSTGNKSNYLDVTHGWLGNDHGWYYSNDPRQQYLNANFAFNVHTGERASSYPRLEVEDPTGGDVWFGNLGHMFVSPSGYMIGNGKGFIAGHGRALKYANTDWKTQKASERNIVSIRKAISLHYMFSPDAKYVVTANTISTDNDCGMIFVISIDNSSEPQKIARYKNSTAVLTQSITCDPGFSPDGTKNIFYGDIKYPGNDDIYIVVFKKPETPTNLKAILSTSPSSIGTTLTWKPAKMHREIKQYVISSSLSSNDNFQQIAIVNSIQTYLNAASKIGISETIIYVDNTTEFPDSGTIEISGLSTEIGNELVRYSGKTLNSFLGCTRGVDGSIASEHYNDAFVWLYTGTNGIALNTITTKQWFKIKSVEWSDLESVDSNPIQSQCSDNEETSNLKSSTKDQTSNASAINHFYCTILIVFFLKMI